MATVTKTKGKNSKKTKKPASEEIMDHVDPVDETAAIVAEKDDIIAQLNEKIRSMTIEIEALRKCVPKKRGTSVTLVGESSKIKTPAKSSRKNTLLSSSSVTTPSRQKSELNVSIKTKGCTCKGLCKTKICGCVKKNQPCTENCKCTEACENLSDEVFDEENKENAHENHVNNNVKIEHEDVDSDDDDYSEVNDTSVGIKKSTESNSTLPSSGSYGSESPGSSQSSEEDEQKDNFNPMIPTKTLARSPLVGKSESKMNQLSPRGNVDNNKLAPHLGVPDTAINVKAKGKESDGEGDDNDDISDDNDDNNIDDDEDEDDNNIDDDDDDEDFLKF
ncbi:protein PFC0760c-like isoform X2 [Aphidius gifuensis]|uniref:protein PFC0760c-like isoform X2 n=1 Tax=Aphidius gifuensis TaxID=684658 RepID=UPI001CDD44C6|nr:protein PFC0760c-like isoform X2 [Aphidius gifuensis]